MITRLPLPVSLPLLDYPYCHLSARVLGIASSHVPHCQFPRAIGNHSSSLLLRLRHLRRCLEKVLWAHLDNKSLQVEDCRLRCLRTRPDRSLCSSLFPSLYCVCSFFFLTHVRHVNFYFLLISLNDFLFFFFAQAFFGYVFALSPFLPVSLSVLPVPGHRLGSVLGPLSVPGSLFVLSAADLARICWQRLLCLGLPPVDDVWDFLAIFIYLKMKRRTHKVKQGGGAKRRRDHSCKGGFNVALICGNRALNVAIFEVKLLELFDAMRCETSRGGVRGGKASPDEQERQLPTMRIQLPLPLLLLWFRSACLPACLVRVLLVPRELVVLLALRAVNKHVRQYVASSSRESFANRRTTALKKRKDVAPGGQRQGQTSSGIVMAVARLVRGGFCCCCSCQSI